ncbi:hypothetical protein [Citrobacter braakii]|uniref:hypothetical protein n=1 Tax=Citrobacter braakii TaxID=57706 RepID=UPI000E0918E5|nr:hypothetical protein [Citrobacter braakii]MBJ9237518.1 hypothetical protein [Citrobacter braakii]MCI4256736.1 hypothetical protein [Dickeya dianthicola]SUX72257.1 Uncharacterised protein [Citrobacter freundii]
MLLRDGQITAADIGAVTVPASPVQREVKVALFLGGDVKDLLRHAGAQCELHVSDIASLSPLCHKHINMLGHYWQNW